MMRQVVRRGAPPLVLDDGTPLGGDRIDVAVRVGWTVRMTRLLTPEPPRMQDLAARIGVSSALVHRVETGLVRSGAVATGYEQVLDLPAGSLRAPIDMVCRGFTYAPVDRDPGPVVTSVRAASALTDRVLGPDPHGGDWLAWARALSQPGAIGLPVTLACQIVDRLAGELNRAVGPAYHCRYEALSLLRCGPYGSVVLDVARVRVADPDVQVLYDLMSAVGEASEPEAVAWCLGLLGDPRDRVVIGAALGLENLGLTSDDPQFWADLVDPLLTAYDATAEGSVGWQWISHLLRLVPRAQLAGRARRPGRPLAPDTEVRDTSRGPQNAHWTDAQRRARVVTAALGMREEPMLARMLYEIAYGPLETRAVASAALLSAVPRLSVPVADQVADLAETHADPVVRDRAERRLSGLVHGPGVAAVGRWLHSEDPDRQRAALLLAASAGLPVPEPVLVAAMAAGDVRSALYAAGLSGHPLVARLAADPTAEDGVRRAARWWLREGTRVSDPPPAP